MHEHGANEAHDRQGIDCLHDHSHTRRDNFLAAGLNLFGGATELLVGRKDRSFALFADTVHNLGDAFGYSIGGFIDRAEESTKRRWRKLGLTAVCLGGMGVCASSGYETFHNTAASPEPSAPAAAILAGVIGYGVHKKMAQHEHLGGSHADDARHARWDVRCSYGTIAATALAAAGVPKVDSIGGIFVSGMTIWANWPTSERLSH